MNTLLPLTDNEVARSRERLFAATLRARRRHTMLTVGLSVGALVVGATTAGAVVQSLASIDDRNTSFDCYTSTDVNAAHGTSVYADDGRDTATLNSMAERVRFAIQTCEAGYTAIPTDPNLRTAPIDVPNPTACLLGDGRLAVFPNKDDLGVTAFCDSLALTDPHN